MPIPILQISAPILISYQYQYSLNTYCIRDIHVTKAIHSCMFIYHAPPLVYKIPFSHGDVLNFSCADPTIPSSHRSEPTRSDIRI